MWDKRSSRFPWRFKFHDISITALRTCSFFRETYVKPPSPSSKVGLALLVLDYFVVSTPFLSILDLRHHRPRVLSPGFSFERVDSPSLPDVPFRSVSRQIVSRSHSFSAPQTRFFGVHCSQNLLVLPQPKRVVCLVPPDETEELWIWRRMLLMVACYSPRYLGHLWLLT